MAMIKAWLIGPLSELKQGDVEMLHIGEGGPDWGEPVAVTPLADYEDTVKEGVETLEYLREKIAHKKPYLSEDHGVLDKIDAALARLRALGGQGG